ncbi:helix-turn-helix domain-containing protein [Larkinella sp. VNQ87]|uniref:helix-turn-helix domain-containing protein n=1 Tax=Larkinella sp. VNQ87 TaxID=3400921 RepID=UPI003BFCC2EA
MEIGEKIRHFRVIKKYSQENMAYELNISITAYGNIERGKSDISYSRLKQISDVLEMPVYIIVGYSDQIYLNSNRSVHTKYGQNRVESIFATNRDFLQELQVAELKIEALERELSLTNELLDLLKSSRC